MVSLPEPQAAPEIVSRDSLNLGLDRREEKTMAASAIIVWGILKSVGTHT